MNLRVALQFIAIVLIWGSTWLVIRDQLAVVDPSWSIAYRFLLAGVTMMLWCAWKKVSLRLSWQALIFALVFALFQFAISYNFVYRAEHYIASGIPAVAFALLIVPNSLLAWIFLKRSVSRRFVFGALMGVAGILMLFSEQITMPGAHEQAALGIWMTVAGMLSASIGNVMQGSRRAVSFSPLAILAWGMLLAGVVNTLIALVLAGPPTWDPRPSYLGGIFYLGVLGSAFSFAIYFEMLRRLGPGEAAWTSVLVPVVAMALSTVWENYQWTWMAALGAVFALVGLAVALLPARSSRRRQKVPV